MSESHPIPVIAIIGAGLSGTMAAVLLNKLGFLVEIYEKRPDPRTILDSASSAASEGGGGEFGRSTSATKRSINLALSHRGMQALAAAGILDLVMPHVIRMPCRVIHQLEEQPATSPSTASSPKVKIVKQPYGTPDQAIWSVSREVLNALLLDAAAASKSTSIFFDTSLVSADKTGACVFKQQQDGTSNSNNSNSNSSSSSTYKRKTYSLVLGADGAYSATRESMLRQGRVNFSRTYIAHGYKELCIPAVAVDTSRQPPHPHPIPSSFPPSSFSPPSPPSSKAGDDRSSSSASASSESSSSSYAYALESHEGLHIWPRGRFMLIALPNEDKSFTATLFAPNHGPDGFDSVDPNDASAVTAYFQRHFPDVLPLMPDLAIDYRSNPVGSLVTVRVDPWVQGSVLLLGDAAHAVVPFFGQGMNAG